MSLLLFVVFSQFDPAQKTALVMYPETNEEEWINLTELVQERCIAVGEAQGRRHNTRFMSLPTQNTLRAAAQRMCIAQHACRTERF